MSLVYPPEWKFEDGDEVPAGVVRDVTAYVERIAKGAPDEKDVVETFKSRFGSTHTSSNLSFAYGDLQSTLASAQGNGAIFAAALWSVVSELEERKFVVPTLAQINKMFAKHGFLYAIAPPRLLRLAETGTAAADVPPSAVHIAHTDARESVPYLVPPGSQPVAAPTTRPTCFVAQPFHEPFQTRFNEDVKPSIEAAGLDAYKVDGDAAADWLVEDIQAAIKQAAVVLVDITEDKPNVWYELGFSQALDKPLVMICCTTERGSKAYPFDVGGRKIIEYTTGTRGAHDRLQRDVTERIKALLAKENGRKGQKSPPGEGRVTASATVIRSPPLDDADILSILESWMKKRTRLQNTSVIYFESVEFELGLPAGSVARLVAAAAETLSLAVRRSGAGTILFFEDVPW